MAQHSKDIAKLPNLDNPKSIMEFLNAPTIKFAEALTGILASETKDWKLSTGRIVQASLKGKLLTQVGRELKDLINKGKIKEDYYATHKNQVTLLELLKFIDDEIPDEERFKAAKSIFLCSVSKDAKEQDEELAYQLFMICKKLSSGELLVLKANWNILKGQSKKKIDEASYLRSARDWLNAIAAEIGHNLPDLVEYFEDNLLKNKLLTDRNLADRSGLRSSATHHRLTLLGYRLCEYITKYE